MNDVPERSRSADARAWCSMPAHIWLVDRYARLTGIDVEFEHPDGRMRLGASVETAAYRIVQEALTNVAGHARSAAATVQVRVEGKRLVVRVMDTGCGFQANQAAYWAKTRGLASTRERAAVAGGSLPIVSQPAGGM